MIRGKENNAGIKSSRALYPRSRSKSKSRRRKTSFVKCGIDETRFSSLSCQCRRQTNGGDKHRGRNPHALLLFALRIPSARPNDFLWGIFCLQNPTVRASFRSRNPTVRALVFTHDAAKGTNDFLWGIFCLQNPTVWAGFRSQNPTVRALVFTHDAARGTNDFLWGILSLQNPTV